MPRIIIAAPSYTETSGGCIILHKLCDILLTHGYDAYLTCTSKMIHERGIDDYNVNPKYKYQLADSINVNKDIVIYTETESGNEFDAKYVVRYIMNRWHLPSEYNYIATWNANDYWLYYSENFYDGIKDKNILTLIEPNLDIFKNYNLDRKFQACHTYRKNYTTVDIVHPDDSIHIDWGCSNAMLIEYFNTCKQFYCYDHESHLSILAAMCGCESIIVPRNGVTKKDLVKKIKLFKYGIAYGIKDIEYANKTVPLLIKELYNIELQQIINTRIEFEKIFKYFKLS